jgi:carboxypeptidase C (cathepsin A)
MLTLFAALLSVAAAPALAAAPQHPRPKPRASMAPMPQEKSVVTHHRITVNGATIDYTATAGTLIVKNDKGEPQASLFYVAYTKDGADRSRRPVTFLYNGGPGCASSPLHMLALGPRRVVVQNAVPNSSAPAQIVDNSDTLLDTSDLVFIDAPGTGYSKLMPKVDPKTVYGIDQDAAVFSNFIVRYITLNDRWNSPKFILGESYGTPRSAAVSDYLLTHENLALNGVVLLSSVLDFDTIAPGPGNDLAYIAYLPTEAATRWYHEPAASRGSLQAVVDRARTFANGPYADALLQGDRLGHDQFVKVATEMAQLTGLSTTYVEQSNLRVQPQRFMKELLRQSGQQVGRLDARYTAYDEDQVGDSQEFDPADSYVSPLLQSGFLSYVRNELNWKSDAKYPQCNFEVNQNWDFTRKSVFGWLAPTTSPDLQDALTQDPKMRVFVGAGYFDMATPFGAAEWTFSHLGLQPPLRSHVQFSYYESGHMVYLNPEARAKFHNDLVKWYANTLNQ